MEKNTSRKYYTMPLSDWDSYESKCIRNNASFEIGFIRESKKPPDSLMVYLIKRELQGRKKVTYQLVEHTLKDVQSIGGYSRYNMQCKALQELELIKSIKGNQYAMYAIKQPTRKTPTRKIKPNKFPMTKLIL